MENIPRIIDNRRDKFPPYIIEIKGNDLYIYTALGEIRPSGIGEELYFLRAHKHLAIILSSKLRPLIKFEDECIYRNSDYRRISREEYLDNTEQNKELLRIYSILVITEFELKGYEMDPSLL